MATRKKEERAGSVNTTGRLKASWEGLAGIPIRAYRSDGTITFWNEACESLYGYATHEAMGRDVVELLCQPEACADERRAMAEAVRAGVLSSCTELPLRHRDGSIRWILANRALTIPHGETPEFVSIDTDITERKRQEEETSKRERLYQTLFDMFPFACVANADDGRYLLANQAFSRLSGYSAEEALGKTPDELGIILQGRLREHITETLHTTHEPLHDEAFVTVKGGETRLISYVSQLLDSEPGLVLTVTVDITERKQAEIALRHSEEKYHTLFELLVDAVFIADSQGRFLEVNTAASDRLGYSREELLGMCVQDISETPPDVFRFYCARLAQEESVAYETSHRRRDGRPIPVELLLKSIQHEGSPAFLGIARDISAWKRTEKALRESEEKYRELIETTDTGYVIIDEHGWLLDANTNYAHISGHERVEDILHHNIQEWTPGGYGAQENHDRIQLCLDQGFLRNFEIECTHPDGVSVPVEINATVVKTDAGTNILALCRDITDRKRAEEALRLSEAKLSSIFRAAPVGIGLISDRVFVEANEVLCQMTGYEHEQLIGKNARFLYLSDKDYEDTGTERYRHKKRVAESGTGTVETRWRRSNGDVIDVRISGAFVNGKDFEQGLVFTVLNITGRKRAEEALSQRNDELAALNQLARSVASQFSLQDVCCVAVERVYEALKSDSVVLFIRDGNDLRLLASAPEPTLLPVDGTPVHRMGTCLCGLAAQTIEPLYVIDVLHDPRCAWTECRDAGLHSFAAIPLHLGGKSLGVLGVGSQRPRNFEIAARYLETAADQLSMSVHNTQLLERSRAYAAQLQQAVAERDLSQISLRKRQEEVTQANLMLQNVLDTIPVRVFWKDQAGRYMGCNMLFARDTGHERPEQIAGKNDYDILAKEHADRYRNTDKNIIESGRARLDFEESQVRTDGTLAHLRTSKVPLRNIADEIVGILGTYEDITEHKKAEEALRNSENRLREIVTRISGLLFQFYARPNGEYGLYYASERIETVFELSHNLDGLFERFVALLIPECRTEFLNSIREAVRNEADWNFEGWAELPSGRMVRFVANSSPTRFPDELVFNGVMLDVTQQRHAETERALNVQRTHALLQLNQMTESTLLEIADFALQKAIELTQSKIGYLALLNEDESTLTMLSWSQEALAECAVKGKSLIYPVATTGLWGEAIRQRQPIVTNDYAAANPWKKGLPDGHVALKRHMNIPIFANTRITLLAGVGNKTEAYDQDDVQQMTLLMEGVWRLIERRQANEEREKANALLQAAISQSPSGILIADAPDVSIRWYNRAALEICGGSVDSGLPTEHWHLFRPNGTPYPVDELPLSRAVRSGMTTRNEEAIIRKENAEDRWIIVNAAPIRDGHGTPTAGLMILHDITEHKHAESERERLEAQLRQAQKMEAVGQLAGGIAHDFNNLLLVILGNLDLAESDMEPGSPQEYTLEEARKAAERAADLTRQMLAFSRRQIIQPVHLDLNDIIISVLKMIRRVIGEHIELRFMPGESIGTIHADKGQLEQVLMNLCVNARDAMPTGGTLTIETECHAIDGGYQRDHPWATEGHYAVMSVTDTGCGMDEATRAQVFEPFFTTKEVGQGTGLGLATVYGIVKQHDGLIHVYSELNKGSVFTFRPPVR